MACAHSHYTPYAYLLCLFFLIPPTTEICTLSLHDVLPISRRARRRRRGRASGCSAATRSSCSTARSTASRPTRRRRARSEEHTSELHHSQISYAVFCLKKKRRPQTEPRRHPHQVQHSAAAA